MADDAEPDPAAALLESVLRQCSDHPELLADLAGLRILQGGLVGAEALGTRLGWSHTNWGIDPSDGASTCSAAGVREHRIHPLSAL